MNEPPSPQGVVQNTSSTSHAHLFPRLTITSPLDSHCLMALGSTNRPKKARGETGSTSYSFLGLALYIFSLAKVDVKADRNPQHLQPASATLCPSRCGHGSYEGFSLAFNASYRGSKNQRNRSIIRTFRPQGVAHNDHDVDSLTINNGCAGHVISVEFLSPTQDLTQQKRAKSCSPVMCSARLPDVAAGSCCTLRRWRMPMVPLSIQRTMGGACPGVVLRH